MWKRFYFRWLTFCYRYENDNSVRIISRKNNTVHITGIVFETCIIVDLRQSPELVTSSQGRLTTCDFERKKKENMEM